MYLFCRHSLYRISPNFVTIGNDGLMRNKCSFRGYCVCSISFQRECFTFCIFMRIPLFDLSNRIFPQGEVMRLQLCPVVLEKNSWMEMGPLEWIFDTGIHIWISSMHGSQMPQQCAKMTSHKSLVLYYHGTHNQLNSTSVIPTV